MFANGTQNPENKVGSGTQNPENKVGSGTQNPENKVGSGTQNPENKVGCILLVEISKAVDPHSFFADPDPAVIFHADPDPGAFSMRSGSSFTKIM